MLKGLILSGGTGSRLRPLTYTGAKQLIPIGNKPILFYAIEALRDAGIVDIGIIVGDTANEIKGAVRDGAQFGVNVTYIQQDKPLGLAHAVKIAESFIKDDSFVMYLGDNLVRNGVQEFVSAFTRSSPDALVLLSRVPEPQHFGVVELVDGHVRSLIEKPQNPTSDLALVGVYLFTPSIFTAVNEIKPSPRGELEITDAIQWLVDHGYNVDPHLVTGWWKDTGRPGDVLDANRLMLETLEGQLVQGNVDTTSRISGAVHIGAGSRIENSTVRGPVTIGSGVLIQNSYVGPYSSIDNGVTICSTEIEHSIVLEGSYIESDLRIDESLIGKSVHIGKSTVKPTAARLVLGDNSRCEL